MNTCLCSVDGVRVKRMNAIVVRRRTRRFLIPLQVDSRKIIDRAPEENKFQCRVPA